MSKSIKYMYMYEHFICKRNVCNVYENLSFPTYSCKANITQIRKNTSYDNIVLVSLHRNQSYCFLIKMALMSKNINENTHMQCRDFLSCKN